MTRIGHVFWHTYWEHVRRPGFYLIIVLVPTLLFIVPVVLAAVVVFLVGSLVPATSNLPVGLVDEAGILEPLAVETGEQVRIYEGDNGQIWQLATMQDAEQALEAGHLQAYFLLPVDMASSEEILGRYRPETPPNIVVQMRLFNWLERQVQGEVDETFLARLGAGSQIVHVPQGGEAGDTAVSTPTDDASEAIATNSSRPVDSSAGFGLLLIILYFGRLLSIFTSGFMYESVREESQNRTIEILLTAIPAGSLVGGKILAMLAVGLTQLAIFSLLPLLLLLWVGPTAVGDLLPPLPWGLFFLFIAGGYVLDQIVAAGTGLLRISGGAGPQVANVLGWLGMAGLIYAFTLVPNNPDTPLAVAASLIPFTAPIVVPTRLAFTEIPLWQTAVSLTLLWGSSLFGVWLLSRLVKRNLVGYSDRFRFFRWVWGKWTARREATA